MWWKVIVAVVVAALAADDLNQRAKRKAEKKRFKMEVDSLEHRLTTLRQKYEKLEAELGRKNAQVQDMAIRIRFLQKEQSQKKRGRRNAL